MTKYTFLSLTILGASLLSLQSMAEVEVVNIIPNYRSLAGLNPGAFPVENCQLDRKIGFSASGGNHVSQGNLMLLGYPTIRTNITQGGWIIGGSTFTAPCNGMYVFTISFEKDAYYYGGTTDDVYVGIYQNGIFKGQGISGEGGGYRSTGTYTVILNLMANDSVQTFVSSDSGYKRHLAEYNFSGYLVR